LLPAFRLAQPATAGSGPQSGSPCIAPPPLPPNTSPPARPPARTAFFLKIAEITPTTTGPTLSAAGNRSFQGAGSFTTELLDLKGQGLTGFVCQNHAGLLPCFYISREIFGNFIQHNKAETQILRKFPFDFNFEEYPVQISGTFFAAFRSIKKK
jgi:hypothetical protein